jgi:hypothetical protein
MKKIFFIISLFSTLNLAQELNCNVIVNYESLPVNNRELLAGFGNAIEAYLNSTQFSGSEWGQKIDCTINIFFTGAGSDVDYTAQAVIVSTRPVLNSERQSPILTINDPTWSFRYEKNQALYSQTSFDPLTSFLDFYANMIIGFDAETFERFGGNPYFRRAFDIVNLGNSSSYSRGWERSGTAYSRWGLCEDLLSDRFRPFREAFFVYHYGIDEMQINRSAAQSKIADLITTLDDMRKRMEINSVLTRTFFDSKYGEIIESLRGYADIEIVAALKRIDPAHSARYDDILKQEP